MADKRRLLSQATLSIRHTRGVQDGLQRMPFNDLPPGSFDSKYVIASALDGETKVTSRTYDVCQKGCQAFTGAMLEWEAHQKCGVCKLPRPKRVSVTCDVELKHAVSYICALLS